MTAHTLRLDLYRTNAGWGWRLWSSSDIVSSSSRQNYSKRTDCAWGAERGTGFTHVAEKIGTGALLYRNTRFGHETARLRIRDERT